MDILLKHNLPTSYDPLEFNIIKQKLQKFLNFQRFRLLIFQESENSLTLQFVSTTEEEYLNNCSNIMCQHQHSQVHFVPFVHTSFYMPVSHLAHTQAQLLEMFCT